MAAMGKPLREMGESSVLSPIIIGACASAAKPASDEGHPVCVHARLLKMP